jgi:hypothetical protein
VPSCKMALVVYKEYIHNSKWRGAVSFGMSATCYGGCINDASLWLFDKFQWCLLVYR